MQPYTRILVWENNRRLRALEAFIGDLATYTQNSSYTLMARTRTEKPAAVEARQSLNTHLDDINDVVRATGINAVMTWSPPPAVGGYVQQINLFLNLFNLDGYQISLTAVRDLLVRAKGIYERNRQAALLRTLNPLTYVGYIVEWIGSLPFRLLGRVGFNAARAEKSWLGRLVKFLIEAIVVLSAVATVLDFLGWTDRVRALLKPYLG